MDLGLRLFKDDDSPLYVQAADALRAKIADGEFRNGDKLPSVRKLSDELGVNPATIVAAYRILSNEGLVESRAGSGAYVSGAELPGPARAHERLPGSSDGRLVLDLASNAPPRSLYPLDAVKRFLAEAVDIDGGCAFDYQDAAGYRPLREALAARLRLYHGAQADPDDVHIVSGAQQGLDLVARVLLRRGDVAAIESPGYRGARDSFLAAGARIAPIPVGDDGLDLDALESLAAARPLRLVYVNPSFQNPTCSVYAQPERERLARMAALHGFFIVEDDQLSELAYDGICLPSVRSWDRDGRVFHVRSFSKTVMPGLRIACLESPSTFRDRVEAGKRSIDLSSNGLMQRVLERFLSSGGYDAHLPVVRSRYAQAATTFCAVLEPYRASGLSWRQPLGGINLWLSLPAGSRASAVVADLASRGVAVTAESGFRNEPGIPPDGHLRVSFGSVAPVHLEAAARAIGESAIRKGSES